MDQSGCRCGCTGISAKSGTWSSPKRRMPSAFAPARERKRSDNKEKKNLADYKASNYLVIQCRALPYC